MDSLTTRHLSEEFYSLNKGQGYSFEKFFFSFGICVNVRGWTWDV